MSYPQTSFVPTNDAQHQAVLKLARDWPSLDVGPSASAAPSTLTTFGHPAGINVAETTPPLELVRSKLTALAREGKSDQVKRLLEKFNAKSLTQLDPQHFTAVLAEAGGL